MKSLRYLFLFVCSVLGMACTDEVMLSAGEYVDYSRDLTKLEIIPIKALVNPERGYHLESNYFVDNLKNPWHEGSWESFWIPEIERKNSAKNDGVTLSQLYLYLTQYVGKDLDQAAFDNMQMLFDDTKRLGYKIHLIFAYDHNAGATNVQFTDIFRHLEQLKPFIQKNIGLIDLWQMGFIGAWGEGNSTPLRDDWTNKGKMIKEILSMYPDRFMTLRYPRHIHNFPMLTEAEKARVGYANDFFTASEHPLAPDNDYTFGSEDYTIVANASPYVKVRAEIPYNENTEWGLSKEISVVNTIKILKEHHYDALDITQNNELNIYAWKSYKISSDWCQDNKILFDESYFKDEEGNKVARSAYEFIRDHLGYRLYVNSEDVLLQAANGNLDFDIPIRNVGFAAIKNPRPVYIVLADESNRVVFKEKLDVSPRDWQPYDVETKEYKSLVHHIKGSVAPGISGKYKVGLWLPDPTELLQLLPEYAVRFANTEIIEDTQYRINVIGEVTF
ncbi:DUF4832 domain-containing protein [Bacteroides congonensis]|uniref:DUF4832 domain-containing protein n=1 Tax=Bacteroides congonensis TaxID=1871006 RepID=UPI000933B92B|nr:DUF4832 domain-containing protein [Bacteroides congonensis]